MMWLADATCNGARLHPSINGVSLNAGPERGSGPSIQLGQLVHMCWLYDVRVVFVARPHMRCVAQDAETRKSFEVFKQQAAEAKAKLECGPYLCNAQSRPPSVGQAPRVV
jgi:hypothetical protein